MLLAGTAAAANCIGNKSGNLIVNGDLEAVTAGIPDCWYKEGWEKDGVALPGRDLNWVKDPITGGDHGMVLKTQNTSNGSGTGLAWQNPVAPELVEPNTWYELSFSYATEGIEPLLDTDGNMLQDSVWIGAGAIIWDGNWNKIDKVDSLIWAQDLELDKWDDSAWVYRTYKKTGLKPWKDVKKYFKTPAVVGHIYILTYNYPKGTAYFDNFSLRKIGYNPNDVPFKKSGTLRFLQFKDEDFFPIFLHSFPQRGGTDIGLNEVKENGFNTTNSWNKTKIEELDLASAIDLPEIHKGSPDNLSWYNDPGPGNSIAYTGKAEIKTRVSEWKDFDNLLFFITRNEIECHPVRDESFVPDLETYKKISEYVRGNGAKIFYGFCGSYYNTPEAYTGSYDDFVNYYHPLADIISHTANLPPAYPSAYNEPQLDKVGIWTRTDLSRSPEKYFIARGFSRMDWANWDRAREADGSVRRYDIYVPFNLQRFLVWTQIINGATGADFLYTSAINLTDKDYAKYYAHSWKQITAISKELSELYPVLVEPQFLDEWQVSDPRVEIMMKKHDEKIYLFAASTHYEDLLKETITLDSKYNIAKITALNEVINGDVDNPPTDRSIELASPNSFVDDFVGDDGSHASAASPGYAVHIYEIELSACGNGTCDSGETVSCPQDCQECVDTPTLMNQYIPQWKRGEISMLTLMQKIRQRNTGEGCPQ